MAKFTSVSNNNFARKLWFARLRAAGLYRKQCTKAVGACAKMTKVSATTLKTTKYANLSPRSQKQQKDTRTRSERAIKELLAQAKNISNKRLGTCC